MLVRMGVKVRVQSVDRSFGIDVVAVREAGFEVMSVGATQVLRFRPDWGGRVVRGRRKRRGEGAGNDSKMGG